MKTMLKYFTVITVCMVLAMLIVAGGNQPAAAKDPVKLTWWHLWGGSRTPLIDKLLVDYKKMHPEVEIEVTFTPPNELNTKVIQAAGTGTLPDVVEIHSGWYVNLDPTNTLLKLDDYLKKENIVLEKILMEAEAKRSYYQGAVYSLPNVNAGGQGFFFYNIGLMEKAGLDPVKDLPKNWDELIQVSKTLVEKLNPGNQLDVIAWYPWQDTGQPMVTVYSYGVGHPIVSEDGKTSLLDTPEVIETAQKFDQYVETVYGKFGGYKALIEWASRTIGVETGAAQVQPFVKEAQVFYISGSWTIGQVESGNKAMKFGLMPIPGFTRQHGATAKDGWSYAINKNSKNADAAWEFLKFITLDLAGNGEFCKAQNRPCPIAAVNQDPYYQVMGDRWAAMIATMNLDVIPATDVYQNTLIPWFRDVPSRRVAGEAIGDIMKDVHAMFQDYLNDLYSK
jgi:multiple sugar transport system substrate-binding protein